ncbi:hypothetical protein ACVILE_003201 [Streptomyces sp. M18.1]
MTAGPAATRQSGGEQRFGPARRLLGAGPQRGHDHVHRGDHGDDHHHHRGERLGDAGAADAFQGLLELVDVLQHVLGLSEDRPVHRAHQEQTRAETGQHAAVQPQGEPERGAERGGGDRPARLLRPDARAHVPPGGEREARRRAPRRQGEAEQQRPPVVVDVDVGALRPADRGEPGQGAVLAAVTGGAQHVGGADDREGRAGGAAGVRGELGGDGGHAGEDEAGGGMGRAVQQRSARVDAVDAEAAQAERQQQAEDEVGQGRDREGGGEVGVPADDRGAQQFGPAGLLLGAGVAGDHQDAHQADQDGREAEHLVAEHGAGGVVVEVVTRAGHGESGRAAHGLHGVRPVLGRAVQLGVAVRGRQGAQQQREDPHREPDAVAAQGEADERAGAGQRAAARGGPGTRRGPDAGGLGRGGHRTPPRAAPSEPPAPRASRSPPVPCRSAAGRASS